MKKYLGTIFGISLVSSLVLFSASPAISDEIEWEEIPGTRVTDDPAFGDFSSSIGTNTMARRVDAINFDFLSGADAKDHEFIKTQFLGAGSTAKNWVLINPQS